MPKKRRKMGSSPNGLPPPTEATWAGLPTVWMLTTAGSSLAAATETGLGSPLRVAGGTMLSAVSTACLECLSAPGSSPVGSPNVLSAMAPTTAPVTRTAVYENAFFIVSFMDLIVCRS